MSSSENDGASRRISVDLPNQDIERLDHLKREWGLRGRGDVLKRLLEEIFPNNVNQEAASLNLDSSVDNNNSIPLNNKSSIYNEDKALVLITKADLRKSENIQSTEDPNQLIDNNINTNNSKIKSVTLANKNEINVDNVICNADPTEVYENLLGNKKISSFFNWKKKSR